MSRLSHRIIPGAIMAACVAAAPLCAVVASWDAFSRFERGGFSTEESSRKVGSTPTRLLSSGETGVRFESSDVFSGETKARVARPIKRRRNPSQGPSFYTVTAYSHRCAMPRDGRERAPRPAANGEWPIPGLTLAADWTLHPPGSVLIVGGRRWRVTDRGHDIRGRRLDLFYATCAEARIYGRRVVPVSVEGE